jgi:hypothetical protein
MRVVATVVGVVIIGAGVVGVVSPDVILTVGQYSLTPTGLYAIAALRVAFGLVFALAAPGSRAPKTLLVLGILVVGAGVTTALLGVERARAIYDVFSAQDLSVIRLLFMLIVVIGCLVTYAVSGQKR